MQISPQPRRRRLLVAAITTGVALLALTGIGIYGLLLGPSATPPTAGEPSPSSRGHAAPPTRLTMPAHISPTRDPMLFARQVATMLFTWDTRTADVSAWAQPLVDLAAPDDAPAVAADVRGYLPDPASWQRLRTYGTRQWLEVGSIAVPLTWNEARSQAAPGQLPPGAGAYTVTGIRHRTGVFGTRPVATERPVDFTLFIACPLDIPCRLLRLSAVDQTLP